MEEACALAWGSGEGDDFAGTRVRKDPKHQGFSTQACLTAETVLALQQLCGMLWSLATATQNGSSPGGTADAMSHIHLRH